GMLPVGMLRAERGHGLRLSEPGALERRLPCGPLSFPAAMAARHPVTTGLACPRPRVGICREKAAIYTPRGTWYRAFPNRRWPPVWRERGSRSPSDRALPGGLISLG
ncbi:MAG: hypothetical protein ACKOJF_03765, partial [Planctomycetaceae bacterium]